MGNSIGNDVICGDGGDYVENDVSLIEGQPLVPLVSIVIPTYNRKEKLIRLIGSIQESDYKNLEIIVVDDSCTDGTYDTIKKIFPNIQIVRNEKELLLAGSRNVGIRHATGKYIFLIDDENVVDKYCISRLKDVLEKDNALGMVGPIMYYLQNPDKVWWAGTERNMTTSKTILNNKIEKIKKCKDVPNAFMIKKDIVDNIGFFDEETFSVHYDEADFGERMRRYGYHIVCDPKAKVWHDIPEGIESLTRFRHVHNNTRAYYAARNRIMFHKKYSTRLQFILFIFIFNWVMTCYYITIILTDTSLKYNTRIGITNSYIKGIIDGI